MPDIRDVMMVRRTHGFRHYSQRQISSCHFPQLIAPKHELQANVVPDRLHYSASTITFIWENTEQRIGGAECSSILLIRRHLDCECVSIECSYLQLMSFFSTFAHCGSGRMQHLSEGQSDIIFTGNKIFGGGQMNKVALIRCGS